MEWTADTCGLYGKHIHGIYDVFGMENRMENRNLTIGDIAAELGVSKTTISRAISGKGRIGEQTRRKVQDYIKEHNYSPNAVAQGLAKSKTFNLGLVIPGDYNVAELPFFQQCMTGISRAASARGYDVLIIMVMADEISQLSRAVTNRKIDGVILSRTVAEDRAINYLAEWKVPFVTVGGTKQDGVAWIDNDHVNACRELTEYLLRSGAQRMALLGGAEHYIVNRKRKAGFEAAFAGRQEAACDRKIFLNVEKSGEVQKIVEQLLEEQTECIIAMDDFLCGCVMNYLQMRRIRIPEQIRVASFYDSTLLSGYLPPIPSIRFDTEKVGRMACEQLFRLLDGEETESGIVSEYELRL